MTITRKRRGRGEGSIYQDATGRWVASLSRGIRGDGRRRRQKITGKTKKEVQKRLGEILRSGGTADATRMTVGECVTRWLNNTSKASVGGATWEGYESIVRLHILPYLDTTRLSALTPDAIEHYYGMLAKASVSAATMRRAAVVLTVALRHAVKRGWIASSPAEGVVKPRVHAAELRVWSEQQTRAFLDAACPHPLYALFALAVGSGMRQGEMLALTWKDIDVGRGTIAVRRSLSRTKAGFVVKEPKTKQSRRTLQVPPFVLDALTRHRVAQEAKGLGEAPVFCTRSGGFIAKNNLRRQVFKPIVKRAGLPEIRFHDLRHVHASTLLANGFSIKAVSQRLGHSTVEMTLRVYCHVMPGDDGTLASGLQRMFG